MDDNLSITQDLDESQLNAFLGFLALKARQDRINSEIALLNSLSSSATAIIDNLDALIALSKSNPQSDILAEGIKNL
ncbi:hypothetical protein MCHI_000755, partial [Candidatus Magnetoovum chiemensis]